jgi:hypothetical protein
LLLLLLPLVLVLVLLRLLEVVVPLQHRLKPHHERPLLKKSSTLLQTLPQLSPPLVLLVLLLLPSRASWQPSHGSVLPV